MEAKTSRNKPLSIALVRGYGATAARLTPDQKVGSSNLSALIFPIALAFFSNLWLSGGVFAFDPAAEWIRHWQISTIPGRI